MAFHPDDIVTKTFTRKAFGGFSTPEVIAFLKSIADNVAKQNQENQELSKKLKEKDIYIRECRDRESLLKNTILSAQKMADKIKQDAEKQARVVLEDAQQKADILVQDARDSLKTAYQDLSDLRRLHIQLKNTLKAVLQSHQDLLDQDPLHSILPSSLHSVSQESQTLIEKKVTESLNQAVKSKDYL